MHSQRSNGQFIMRDSPEKGRSSNGVGQKLQRGSGLYSFGAEDKERRSSSVTSNIHRRTPSGNVYYAAANDGLAHNGSNSSRSVDRNSSNYPVAIANTAKPSEVEEKIRNLKKAMAEDTSSRLAAYEARKQALAEARRRREEEQRRAAMAKPPSNLSEYQQDLSEARIPQSTAQQRPSTANPDELEKEGVEFGHDRSSRAHRSERGASRRSVSVDSSASHRSSSRESTSPYNPGTFPDNKRIDPSDVVYVSVQGRLNQLLSKRRAASTSQRRLPSSEFGNLAAYTEELELARARKTVGQEGLRSEHHYSTYGAVAEADAEAAMWRQQPLRSVRSIDWRSRDDSLVMGKTPKSVRLRQQHTKCVLATKALHPVLDTSEITAGHVPDQRRLFRAAKRPQRTPSQMAARSFNSHAPAAASTGPFNTSLGLVPHELAGRNLDSTLTHRKLAAHSSHHANVEHTPRNRFEVPFDTELSPMSDSTAAGSPSHLGNTLKPHSMESLPSQDQQSTRERSPVPRAIVEHNPRSDAIRRAVEAQRRRLIERGVIRDSNRPNTIAATTAPPSVHSSLLSSIQDQEAESLRGYTTSQYSYYKSGPSLSPTSGAGSAQSHSRSAQPQPHVYNVDTSPLSSRYISPSKDKFADTSYSHQAPSTSYYSPPSANRGHAVSSNEVRKTLFSPEQPRDEMSPPAPVPAHSQSSSARERLLAVGETAGRQSSQGDSWRTAREGILQQHNNSVEAPPTHVDPQSADVSAKLAIAPQQETSILVDDGFQTDDDIWGFKGNKPTAHAVPAARFNPIRSDLFVPGVRQHVPQPTAATRPFEPSGGGNHPGRPQPSSDSVGARRTNDPRPTGMSPPQSFNIAKRAFSRGAPLPHEAAPPHQVRGDQEVAYYQEENFESLKHSPPPQPNDPTRALLMQVLSAQRHRR